MLVPDKLKKGDEVRIISPSNSLAIISRENRQHATCRLEALGLKVSFSRHVEECDTFSSSSIESRVADLHEAFQDPAIKAIFTTIGGYNCNQLLRYLDYDLLAKNPKILCGYSDITALQLAIWAKIHLVTYSGPHYSTFGCISGIDYMVEYFQKCCMKSAPITVLPSANWSNDAWYLDQENRTFFPNNGYQVIQEGEALGTLLGGNLATLNLLQGTEFMPSLNNTVLFLEDDALSNAAIFDRDLQSLIHQPSFEGVRGLVLGRFERKSEMTYDELKQIIASKKELKGIPVIGGADFGHTLPLFTFPIGGEVSLLVRNNHATITITKQ